MRRNPSIGRHPAVRLFLLVAVFGAPLAAEAYVGPGAGLSLFSALWGLLCAIGAAFLFVILWPIRRMRRRRREARESQQASNTAAGSTAARQTETSPGNTHADGDDRPPRHDA